jgi:protein O-mannosyl-transferase
MRLRSEPGNRRQSDGDRPKSWPSPTPPEPGTVTGEPLAKLGEWARGGWAASWLPALLVAALAFLAYAPCLRGDFLWDDDAWTLKLERLFQGVSGLGQIWTNPVALQQFYPLTATTFWLDYRLWGFWTTPYHVENLLLHLLSGWLLWQLLKRLAVPGAGIAAAVFVLHPLMVESVAWITERKNVLSLALFLAALNAYGRFTGFWENDTAAKPNVTTRSGRKWGAYLVALALFLAADLAKGTAFALPAVLLLVAWWKRGSLGWRSDVIPALPFFAFSIALGLLTYWLEQNHVGARGPEWEISVAGRCLVAGRALWFYAGKLLWPLSLCFIYPRWQVDIASPSQWAWPVSALAVPVVLWSLRKRLGRGPLTAVLFYAGALFPLLGFLNGYFMRYSFVCDHWSYLPSVGLIALGGAAVATFVGPVLRSGVRMFVASLVLIALATLTCRQSATYTDAENLYRTILAKNPQADLAHNNLGLLLAQAGEFDEAIAHFEQAVRIRPHSAHAHNNLANALRVTGRGREAAAHYESSLKFEPDNLSTCNNLAFLFATSADASLRNGARAIELAERANRLAQGRNPSVLATLAAAFAEAGRFDEAVTTARQALEMASSNPNSQLVARIQAQLESYSARKPFHEPAPAQQPGADLNH